MVNPVSVVQLVRVCFLIINNPWVCTIQLDQVAYPCPFLGWVPMVWYNIIVALLTVYALTSRVRIGMCSLLDLCRILNTFMSID